MIIMLARRSEAGLLVSGGDLIVEALVDPATLADEFHLPPSAGHRAELGAAWQRADQALRLRAARQLAALQHVDGVPSDYHAAVLGPEDREAREVDQHENKEVRCGLVDERLTDLTVRRQERC